jgi:poly(A) polymerase/tRNA nucleotidyltransferase (CCA-adding enzyme)
MTLFTALLADPALAPILAALPGARLVGGCVRDTLARVPIVDIDIATPEPPEAALAALEGAGLRVIPTGLAHGTLTALSQGRPFEITSLRRDEATDGRHARVAWTSSFEEDAARRDFTINAMSVDRDGWLHDYFGGAADLAGGRVRFVGAAAQRVAEDYLRILRFFRFFSRYGVGLPDPDAASAIKAGLGGLARLSAERVWSELKRIITAGSPARTVRLMQELGVLQAVLPEAGNVPRFERMVEEGAPADPVLRLAALLSGDPLALAERLKLSSAERDGLAALTGGPAPTPGDDDTSLRQALADTPEAVLIGRSWLAGGGDAGAALRARLAGLTPPSFPLEGRHALALGAQPGPRIGEALRAVRAWWWQGGCVADEAACLARLEGVLATK